MALDIEWTEEARADIRDPYRYAVTRQGDLRRLEGSLQGKLRLRLGDYRVFFTSGGRILRILAVKHRRETYR